MRPEKQLLLDEIREQIDNAAALVLTQYQKMSPNLAADFRAALIAAGGNFEVVKKRILIKAVEAAGFKLDLQMLQGHIGVVLTGGDPVQITKILYTFLQENPAIFEVVGGRFEGKLCTANDVKQISELPTKDEMRAQLLGVLEAPLSHTLSVMEALLTSVPHCLENFTTKE